MRSTLDWVLPVLVRATWPRPRAWSGTALRAAPLARSRQCAGSRSLVWDRVVRVATNETRRRPRLLRATAGVDRCRCPSRRASGQSPAAARDLSRLAPDNCWSTLAGSFAIGAGGARKSARGAGDEGPGERDHEPRVHSHRWRPRVPRGQAGAGVLQCGDAGDREGARRADGGDDGGGRGGCALRLARRDRQPRAAAVRLADAPAARLLTRAALLVDIMASDVTRRSWRSDVQPPPARDSNHDPVTLGRARGRLAPRP